MRGDEASAAYIARQAATVGRCAAAPDTGVPRLANARAPCLGVVQSVISGDAGGVALDPGGRILVTGDPDGKIRCWELRLDALDCRVSEQHGSAIWDIAVSPDGGRLATASRDNIVRIWSTASGQGLLRLCGHHGYIWKVSWSPDGRRLASSSSDSLIRFWDAHTGACVSLLAGHRKHVNSIQWSPDGSRLVSGSNDKTVRIWDTETGRCLRTLQERDSAIQSVAWSPDGCQIAAGHSDNGITLWDARTGRKTLSWQTRHRETGRLACLTWSPHSRWLASGAQGDSLLLIWEAATGRELACYEYPEAGAWRLVWSPNGAFLASSHPGAFYRLWDTRPLEASQSAGSKAPSVVSLPAGLAPLPTALAHLHRLKLYPPLSLLRDLLHLTGGDVAHSPLAPLAVHPGLRGLIELRWPISARVGLAGLLLRDSPQDAWQPPAALPPGALHAALTQALAGQAMEPQAPAPSLAALRQAADRIDDRLLDLLALLGAEAVAAEPGLPLRLLERLPALPALSAAQRRLLHLRLPAEAGGQAQASGGGIDINIERAGIAPQGNLHALLPSQLALPPRLLHSRHQRRELLYRARSGREPPRLHPAVLVLDISPPCFGPVEQITRLAAHIIARSLRQARLPVLLVTTGGAGQVRTLEQPADWVDLWTLRSLEPAMAAGALRTAGALRETLRSDGPEPLIVLLSHAWFGFGETVPPVAALRGLFVQYPDRPIRPVLADRCERWQSLSAGATARLASCLGDLLASDGVERGRNPSSMREIERN